MNDIAVLVPDEKMKEIARQVAVEKHLDIEYIKCVETANIINETRAAVENGVRIVVARGYQAKLIKEFTKIPLAEIRFHTQELGLLIQQAKEIVKKDLPRIGLIVFENMLGDTTYIEELFNIRLSIAFMERIEDAGQRLDELTGDHPDIIIGGKVVCREAQKMGYPTVYYESTRESIAEALLSAKRMKYMAEMQKQNMAQFEAVLDTSFNVIMKINVDEEIIAANKLIEKLLGKEARELVGLKLSDAVPEIDSGMVSPVLQGVKENYVTSVNIRNKAWMLMIAPIQYDDKITGAILSLRKVENVIRRNRSTQQDMFLNGYYARTTFSKIETENKEMASVLRTAQEYAMSESPVLIYAPCGTESFEIAEAIHNNSRRKSGPFVSVNIQALNPGQQSELLFGGDVMQLDLSARMNGAFSKADHGTLLIQGIDHLAPVLQYQIFRKFMPESAARTDALPMNNANVRIIAVSARNLAFCSDFSRELYYVLQGLVLEIPPLKRRSEDLAINFYKYFQHYLEQYNKYLVLNQEAYEALKRFSWDGNLIQLKSFAERLVIFSTKRNIDETKVRKLYEELYPYVDEKEEKVVVYKSREAEALAKVLNKNHGNRRSTAAELGISTTTLWRRMKEYGIEYTTET